MSEDIQAGVIKAIRDDEIKIEVDGEVIVVTHPGGLRSARQHDRILFEIERRKVKGSSTKKNFFTAYPFITTSKECEESVMASFSKIFTVFDKETRKNVLKVPFMKLKQLYGELKTIGVGSNVGGQFVETVSQYLTIKAGQYWLTDRKVVASGLVMSGVKAIGYGDVVKLLRGWDMRHDRRHLYLLGLTYDEIEKSCTYSGELYEKILKNPYMVPWVALEKATDIANSMQLRFSKKDKRHRRKLLEEMQLGETLRSIKATTVDWRNLYISKEYFTEQYDKHDNVDELIERGLVIEEEGCLYLKELYDVEQYVAKYFIDLVRAEPMKVVADMSLLDKPNAAGFCLDEEQKSAVRNALTNNVSIITGQAGTGKTSLISVLLAILEANKAEYMCTSFTGKAVARIKECTGAKAETMHMLMCKSEEANFMHIIIDEASMVDLYLWYRYSRIFNHRIRITIIGDPNQLPQIGWGSWFEELIESGCIPHTKLRNIYRVVTKDGVQDRIIENSKRMIYWEGSKEFDFITGDNVTVLDGDTLKVREVLNSFYAKGIPLSDFVVISPYREQLPIINRTAQLIYNHSTPYVTYDKEKKIWARFPKYTFNKGEDPYSLLTTFHVNDKVMMKKNNYELEVMNGTEGIVLDVNTNFIKVCFSNDPARTFDIPLAKGYRKIDPEEEAARPDGGCGDTNDLGLSFAITVHAAQGSEWKRGIFYINNDKSAEGNSFLNNRSTYTATTRFKEELFVISTGRTAEKSISNKPRKTRERLAILLAKELPVEYKIPSDNEMEKELAAKRAILEKAYQEQYGDYEEEDDYDDYDDY